MLIRAGLSCLDKPRWACKALNPKNTLAYGSCAVGFTGVCFQAGLLAVSSAGVPALLRPATPWLSTTIHTASPTLPRLSGDWS